MVVLPLNRTYHSTHAGTGTDTGTCVYLYNRTRPISKAHTPYNRTHHTKLHHSTHTHTRLYQFIKYDSTYYIIIGPPRETTPQTPTPKRPNDPTTHAAALIHTLFRLSRRSHTAVVCITLPVPVVREFLLVQYRCRTVPMPVRHRCRYHRCRYGNAGTCDRGAGQLSSLYCIVSA